MVDSLGMAMAEAELREMMRNSSTTGDWQDQLLEDMSPEQREVITCCWLQPPSQSEIETMGAGSKKVAMGLWRRKCHAIIETGKYLQTRMNIDEQVSNDIAEHFGGLRDMHYTICKKWGCSQRSFYRTINRAGREIGQVLFRAILWKTEHDKKNKHNSSM